MQPTYRCQMTVINLWQAYQVTTVSWHLYVCCILRKEGNQSLSFYFIWHSQPPPYYVVHCVHPCTHLSACPCSFFTACTVLTVLTAHWAYCADWQLWIHCILSNSCVFFVLWLTAVIKLYIGWQLCLGFTWAVTVLFIRGQLWLCCTLTV